MKPNVVQLCCAAALIAVTMNAAPARAAEGEIVHDAEYYILEAQNGERWSAEDEALDAKLAELREQGEPLTMAEMAPPEIPPDENAAVLYSQASAQFDLLPRETRYAIRNLYIKMKREPLTPEELEEARKLLKDAKEPLRLLREGSRRPRCRFRSAACEDHCRPPGCGSRL